MAPDSYSLKIRCANALFANKERHPRARDVTLTRCCPSDNKRRYEIARGACPSITWSTTWHLVDAIVSWSVGWECEARGHQWTKVTAARNTITRVDARTGSRDQHAQCAHEPRTVASPYGEHRFKSSRVCAALSRWEVRILAALPRRASLLLRVSRQKSLDLETRRTRRFERAPTRARAALQNVGG